MEALWRSPLHWPDSTLSAEQLEQLHAFVHGALEAEDEAHLLEALGQFKPRFLMLSAESPEGDQPRDALKVMAYNMEAMQLTDTTLAKSKRLFMGNADLLPDCVLTRQRLRDIDAPEPAAPQAAFRFPILTRPSRSIKQAANHRYASKAISFTATMLTGHFPVL